MELRYLRYFVAVAEEGHITRAAERLGMQQPPLSQRMAALERELGTKLLRRHARGVAPTEAGVAFLRDARAILDRLDQAALAVRRIGRGEQGRVTVGFANAAPFHPFLPRFLRAFREALPHIALDLEEGDPMALAESLRAGRIDAAFVRTAIAPDAALEATELLREPMIAVLPSGHPLAAAEAPAPALAAFAAEAFLAHRRASEPGLLDAIVAGCREAGFSPRIEEVAPRIAEIPSLVAAGLGVALVPASLGRMRLDGAVFQPLGGAVRPIAPLLLLFRRDEGAAGARRFIDLAQRMARGFEPAD